MKIGIAIWKLDLRGGEQRQALELAKCLQNSGHDVTIYAAYYNPEKSFTDACKQIRNIKFLARDSNSMRSIKDRLMLHFDILKYSKKLADLIDTDLDVLNCHEYTTSIVGHYYKLRVDVPVVGMINDTPSYNGVFSLQDSFIKFFISYLKRRFYIPYLKRLDGITVLDLMNKERLKRFCGISYAKVIRSGLDVERFKFTERIHQHVPARLLAVGTFCVWRRYEDIIRACRILKQQGVPFALHHIGEDSTDVAYAKKIKAMVINYGLEDCIQFHGKVSEKEVEDLYATSDLFLFPNYPQTWGLVVFEAMASGIPVIASNQCGAAEVLEHKKNVYLVAPKAPHEVADAISMLSRDIPLWSNISSNAREFVVNNIRWSLYSENMLSFFEKIIVGKRLAQSEKRNEEPMNIGGIL